MSEPFLGEIKIMSFGFPPQGWAMCSGQLLPINQNQALFSLLGTTYGGDGRVNFGLPDLQARIPIHMGNGHTLGERAGENAHTLIVSEMTPHIHLVNAVNGAPGAGNAGHIPATTKYLAQANAAVSGNQTGVNLYGSDGPAQTFAASIDNTGGNQPHENRQPALALSFCIALEGIFPSQT